MLQRFFYFDKKETFMCLLSLNSAQNFDDSLKNRAPEGSCFFAIDYFRSGRAVGPRNYTRTVKNTFQTTQQNRTDHIVPLLDNFQQNLIHHSQVIRLNPSYSPIILLI